MQKAGDGAGLSSGDSGSRTHDLQIANLSLYQLSYIPIERSKYTKFASFRQAKFS